MWLVPNTVEVSRELRNSRNILLQESLLSFKLGRTFCSTQTDTKLLYKYKHYFSLKNWQFNHKLGPPLSPTLTPCLKDYPHHLTKYKTKRTSQIPLFRLFSELGEIWKYSLGVYSKRSIFYLFPNLA